MRRMLMIALGGALLFGMGQACAQSSQSGGQRDNDQQEREDFHRGRDGQAAWNRGERDRDDRQPGWNERGPRDRADWRAYGNDDGRRGGRAGVSGFHLQIGDTRLDMRCNPNEPMRSCVEAATALLESARARPHPAPGSAPATPNASPPQ